MEWDLNKFEELKEQLRYETPPRSLTEEELSDHPDMLIDDEELKRRFFQLFSGSTCTDMNRIRALYKLQIGSRWSFYAIMGNMVGDGGDCSDDDWDWDPEDPKNKDLVEFIKDELGDDAFDN